MRKLLFLMLAAGAAGITGQAKQLTAQQALDRMSTQQRVGAIDVNKAYDAQSPAYVSEANGLKRYYVFNRLQGDGYVILGADDCAAAILGYSENGTFDYDAAPENLRNWLAQYDSEIDWRIATSTSMPMRAPSARSAIKPMLTSKWNQNEPYNLLCPQISGTPTCTGCVATAMAQVMYYHKWPQDNCTGTISYNHPKLGTITRDFTDVRFDWDAMTDTYSSASSDASNNAVALLMECCGKSVCMNYGVSESGADSQNIQVALIDNFGYDKGTTYVRRAYYSLDQWEDLIYNELANSRPVLYDGATTLNAGHEFVCDGYADGYYHFNWGWGGMSDGYFLITSPNPSAQGIGGSSGAYALDQGAVIGVQPAIEGSVRMPRMIGNGDFHAEKNTYGKNDYVQFLSNNSAFFCATPGGFTCKFGVKLTDSDDATTYIDDAQPPFELVENAGSTIFANFSALANGEYTVAPAFKVGDEWYDVLIPNGCVKQLTMNVTDSQITFTAESTQPVITVSDFALKTPFYNGAMKFTANLSTTLETGIDLRIMICEPGSHEPKCFSGGDYVYLRDGETLAYETSTKVNYYYTNSDPTLVPGNQYDIVLTNGNMNVEYARISSVELTTVSNPTFALGDLKVNDGATEVPANNIVITGKLTCTEGFYYNKLSAYIYPYIIGQTVYSVAYAESDLLMLNAGESAEFKIRMSMSDYDPDQVYVASLGGDNVLFFNVLYPEVAITDAVYNGNQPKNIIACSPNGEWIANEIELLDGKAYTIDRDFTAFDLNYSREFANANWQAFYVPYAISAEEIAPYGEIAYLDAVSGTLEEPVLEWKRVAAGGTLEPNTPYIILPTAAAKVDMRFVEKLVKAAESVTSTVTQTTTGNNFNLTGVYTETTGLKTLGGWALKDGNFHPAATDAVVLKPYRIYLTFDGASSKSIRKVSSRIDGSATDGIQDIIIENGGDGQIYDLLGRPAVNPSAGVYVRDGRKVIIK